MSFNERLDEAYEILVQNKEQSKLVLPVPDIEVTTTNTFWYNVKAFLKKVNRPPKHLINFLSEQLDTNVNQKTQSLSHGIVFIGKIRKNKILPVIDKYIRETILCKTCNNYNTKIKVDKDIRKWVLTCKSCGTTYTL